MASDEKVHLAFGGSSAHRWMRCAGSVGLIATLPPQPENEHMADGTRAHALLELALRERRDTVLDMEGVSLRSGWPPYTKDGVEAVQTALDYVNGILERSPDHILDVELFVTLAEDVGGSMDVRVYEPTPAILHVIDYKHGRGKYVRENTPQTKFYAACSLLDFNGGPVERINATIVQPRCASGDPVRTAVYSPADLMEFADELESAVAAARAPDAPFTPGEDQCTWCPAAAACPALNLHGVAVVSTAFAGCAAEADDPAPTTLSIPSAAAMRRDPARLFETLALLPTLRAWIDAVEAEAEAVGLAGGATPGFKFVPKRATRKWADEVGAREWFLARGVAQDEFEPRKLLSVAQAEKIVKPAGKEAIAAMAAYVTKESSGYNLVPLSAPGEAVSPQALAAASFANAIPLEDGKKETEKC